MLGNQTNAKRVFPKRKQKESAKWHGLMKVHVNNLPNIQEIQRKVGTRLRNHASSSGDRQSAQDAVVISVRMIGGG